MARDAWTRIVAMKMERRATEETESTEIVNCLYRQSWWYRELSNPRFLAWTTWMISLNEKRNPRGETVYRRELQLNTLKFYKKEIQRHYIHTLSTKYVIWKNYNTSIYWEFTETISVKGLSISSRCQEARRVLYRRRILPCAVNIRLTKEM